MKTRLQRCLHERRKKTATKTDGELRTYTRLIGCYRVRLEVK